MLFIVGECPHSVGGGRGVMSPMFPCFPFVLRRDKIACFFLLLSCVFLFFCCSFFFPRSDIDGSSTTNGSCLSLPSWQPLQSMIFRREGEQGSRCYLYCAVVAGVWALLPLGGRGREGAGGGRCGVQSYCGSANLGMWESEIWTPWRRARRIRDPSVKASW